MQLCLPQLMNNEKYRKMYELHVADANQFVILDNGAAEGYTVTDKEIIDLARKLGPDEIVIPDILGDMKGTIERAKKYMQKLTYMGHKVWEFHHMFVAQGETIEEFVHSALWAHNQDWISTVAIPRHAITTCDDELARSIIVEKVSDTLVDIRKLLKPIHFLGTNTDAPAEIKTLSSRIKMWVRSVDTSFPFVAAWHGFPLEVAWYAKRPEEYFELEADSFHDVLEENVDRLIGWVDR